MGCPAVRYVLSLANTCATGARGAESMKLPDCSYDRTSESTSFRSSESSPQALSRKSARSPGTRFNAQSSRSLTCFQRSGVIEKFLILDLETAPLVFALRSDSEQGAIF